MMSGLNKPGPKYSLIKRPKLRARRRWIGSDDVDRPGPGIQTVI